MDSADPYNHIKDAANLHPLLLFEVKDDQTVPNSSQDALIAAAGLTKAKAIGPNPVSAGAGAYTFFTKGYHGTLLSPSVSLAATVEMQTAGRAVRSHGRAAGRPVCRDHRPDGARPELTRAQSA